MKTQVVFVLFTLLILFALTAVAFAQPGLPGNPSQAPIDGGLGLLAALGGIYAYKKLKKRNDEEPQL